MKDNKCIYCGLNLRGKGCTYAPNKIHVVLEPNKCIYCGLSLRGKGCVYSPSGIHVMSSEFGHIQAEKMKDNLIFAYLVEKIQKPFTKMGAYKHGIIDAKGNQIKDPQTVTEQTAFGPTERYIIQLKKIFGNKLDILNTESYLSNSCNVIDNDELVNENWDAEEYIKRQEKEERLEENLSDVVNLFYSIMEQSSKEEIKTEKFEKILLKVINEKII